MTDHPMSCYPGHLEEWVLGARVWLPSADQMAVARWNGHMRGLESYDLVANRAINRAMSGQITSSTGDRDESYNRRAG